MSMDYAPAQSGTKPKRGIAPMLLIPLAAFLLGLIAMGWLLSRWEPAARYLGVAPAPAPVQQAPAPTIAVEPELPPEPAAAPAKAERLVIDPEITRRVNRVEEKLAELDAQSRAAVGNAERAEGLLVAFAARRALDRGVSLGYLEALLRQRFGNTQPQAVATVLTAARQPVTLQDLQEGLKDVRPQLTGAGPEQGWWDALKAELSGMVTVRKQGTPSTMPAERLQRAERRLETGQVDVALAEVLRLPGREKAAAWIADARRYVLARRALDTLETAALLEPRTPQALAQPAPPPAQQPTPTN
ncbi:MAG: COG4223 family protein [Allosphingosinicella sp.]